MCSFSVAKPQDIVGITSLAYETLPERYTPGLFNQLYEIYPEGYLVAKIGPQIIGFLISIKTNDSQARILMLGVHKNHRRKKVASTLFQKYLISALTQNIKIIDLEVRTTNHGAIAFYQRFGFTIQEIIKGFYQNRVDAYSMRLWLKSY
jgi:ribosomal protein S18 acetylase RimI-like enzyme